MEKLKGQCPGPPLKPQEQLLNLKQIEERLSQQLINFPLVDSNLSRYTGIFNRLEAVRQQIADLTSQIPSSGPSPITVHPRNHDPQGRKPWRGRR